MIRVYLASDWVGGILNWDFRPSINSFQNNKGLIGYYDNDATNDIHILVSSTVNGTTVTSRTAASVDQMSIFWR
jgi:hypothetical protein